ncbi:hypothetical protein BG011_006457 [Mortierella polycephala]|uniref:TAFII55 protein conserved region domain-containing protein n=1 Tax=Mortierella polycephala TaxID=41804 RepID=A0A9P6QEP4_9FUNG|nr:hypothetical protein BG011_006457 [Mortierella polycephala]
MSNPGSGSGGSGGAGPNFQPGMYPQPIGTFSGSAGTLPGASNIGTQLPNFMTSTTSTTSITMTAANMSIASSSGNMTTIPTSGTTLYTTNSSSSTTAIAPPPPPPGLAPVPSTLQPQSLQPLQRLGSSPLPITSPPAGTAPRKQLAAAAAAGAAVGSNKPGKAKGTYNRKAGGAGAGGGAGRRGGRGGGRGGGRAGGGGAGHADDEDGVGAGGGKDSDEDNEDEREVSIEEQFILRLPPGEMCDRFREKVISREVDESVKLKFTDARRGTFTFEGLEFPTKLVDLPTVIEAQKTLNGKQMYKVADISQMLLVDPTPVEKPPVEVKTEPDANAMPAPTLPPLKPSEYIWPDGLTNPLKNVRKRRFRKRVSKVAVEGVENEIERLLHEDALAEEVVYEIREQIDGMDRFDSEDGATPAPEGIQSDMDMDMDGIEGEGDEEMRDIDEDEDEDEGDQDDEDLLAELEREIGGGENATDEENGTPGPQDTKPKERMGSHGNAVGITDIRMVSGPSIRGPGSNLAAGIGSTPKMPSSMSKKQPDEDEEEEDEEEEDDDEDEDDDSGSEEEDEEEDEESAQIEKLLKDEINELNTKVKENEEKLQSAPNDILKRRFGSILENLRKELGLKTKQLEEAKERTKAKRKQ